MKKIVTLIPVALLATYGCPAIAGDAAPQLEVRSQTLQYSRVAASTEAGAQALHARIRAAANRLCRDGLLRYGIADRRARACAEEAVNRAVRDIDLPAVTAVQQRRDAAVVLASR